jgi:integrase
MGKGRTGRFTDEMVRGLRVDGKDRLRFEPGSGGFGIRVTPVGAKLFTAQSRVGKGRAKRIALGRFPDVSVAEARKAAQQALVDLRAGKDPVLERQARARATEAGQLTVAEFAAEWLDKHVDKMRRARTAADYRSIVEKRINPAIGHLLLAAVTKADVIDLHEAMAKTPRRANYVTRVIGSLMRYAEDKGKRPQNTNPARGVQMYREGKRERFMSEAEIGRAAEAIKACERSGAITPHAAGGLRLALLTGARSGEITAAQWSQIDWERKFIRLPDSKSGYPRTIYLSDAAMEVVHGLPRVGPYIVAGRKKGRKSKNSGSDDVEAYRNLGRSWIVVRAKAGLDDVRLHDLRHSYASVAAAKGHSLPMIGKLLGHRVAATTQRYAHLARDAVSAVSDELGVALKAAIDKANGPTGTVIGLRRHKRGQP